jgi:hypothetical protein
MRSLPSLSLLLLLLLAGAALAQSDKPVTPDPRIAFEESAVVASGLTPGKPVAWFAVEHRIGADFGGDIAQRYDAGTAAADGTARLDLAQPAAPSSFWVAVDVDSGAFAVAGPDGYRLRKPQRPARPRLGAGAEPDEILDDHPLLVGLVVRPGEGAWAFAVGDGGPSDGDGVNDGHLRFALDRLRPLPGSPAAPSKLNGKDLWFLVDPLTMEIAVHKGGVAQ